MLQSFEIFRANNRFSRKNPDTPAAVVCIGGEHPPSIAELMAAEACAPCATLIIASVTAGTVSFFEMGGCSPTLTAQL